MVHIELYISWYKQVQKTVAIIVSPGWSGRPISESDSSLLGNVREGSIVVVVI
jgi:hypothetical protein